MISDKDLELLLDRSDLLGEDTHHSAVLRGARRIKFNYLCSFHLNSLYSRDAAWGPTLHTAFLVGQIKRSSLTQSLRSRGHIHFNIGGKPAEPKRSPVPVLRAPKPQFIQSTRASCGLSVQGADFMGLITHSSVQNGRGVVFQF